jgi:hypothetical protein
MEGLDWAPASTAWRIVVARVRLAKILKIQVAG